MLHNSCIETRDASRSAPAGSLHYDIKRAVPIANGNTGVRLRGMLVELRLPACCSQGELGLWRTLGPTTWARIHQSFTDAQLPVANMR